MKGISRSFATKGHPINLEALGECDGTDAIDRETGRQAGRQAAVNTVRRTTALRSILRMTTAST